MVDPYIRKLLSFVQEHCIAELSPYGFGAFVCLLVVCCFYILLGRYRNTYIPVQLRCGLLLLAAAYLYYRVSPCCYYRLSPEFYFWRIPLGDWTVSRATWTDLLFLPWLYVMGGRGVLRYLSSNRRCMRMLRVFWMRRIWSKPMRLYKKTVEVELCNLILKQARRCARKLRVLWTRRIWSKLKRLCEQKAEVTRQETKMTSSSLSNPIHCAEDDELDFNPRVSELAKELRGLDLKERSTCYGIIAPWGYGKTSFLNLLSNELSADGIVVTFNPRSAKSVEHIQEDFFAKLAQELSRYYWGAGLIVSRYAEQIGILNHYSTVRLIADASRLFHSKGSKATVSNAIEKIGKRLYIVLDDLDRLEGKELLETIKLIDITASFKNTVFLVACDKKYANDVLQAYLGSNPGLGYLDKYIAVEVQLSEYIEEKLNQMMVRYLREQVRDGVLVTQDTVLQSWEHIAPYIITHLGTCRGIKQYFKLFINDFGKVQDFVYPVDFFLLTLLKYKDKGVYDTVKYRIHFGGDEPFFSFGSTRRWDSDSPLLLLETGIEPGESKGKDFYPGLEEQLNLVVQPAQWDGATLILWMLFPNSLMFKNLQLPFGFGDGYWRNVNAPYSAIRYRRGFTSYFPDLVDDDRDSWHQDVLTIVKCRDVDDVSQILDRRCNEKDEGALVHLLLDHLESFSQPDEAWVTAVRLVMYVADRYDDNYKLKECLGACLRKRNKFFFNTMVDGEAGQIQYKEIMNELLNKAVEYHPQLVCELLAPIGIPARRVQIAYIYTEEEAAELMLKAFGGCLTRYARLGSLKCRAIVNKLLCPCSCFMYNKNVAQQFVSWIQAYPSEGALILLCRYRSTDYKILNVEFESGIASMEEVGFSVKAWVSSIEDTETREVLGVVIAHSGVVACRDIQHDRSLSIAYLHEAFTYAGLIQAKR